MITFTTTPASPSGSSNTGAARRCYLPVETARKEGLVAGEWVRLSVPGDKKSVIAQIWPSITLLPSTISLSPSHSLTLSHPPTVHLTPLTNLSEWPAATSVEVEEVLPEGGKKGKEEAERERGWVLAILKELLINLKYITPSTILSLPALPPSPTSPSNTRTFRITSTLPPHPKAPLGKDSSTGEELEERLGGMSLAEEREGERAGEEEGGWMVGWKTVVKFTEKKDTGGSSGKIDDKSSNPALPSSISIHPPTLLSAPLSPGYSTLGGLTPQITLIRTLLDLPLSHPSLFSRFGLPTPRGVLLHGPPGTGKTLLARAIARSIPGGSLIVVNGPELGGMYHGETEGRLRAVFEEAGRREPCVIFLDEVDALCPRREGGGGGGEEGGVGGRVVATLLTLMDGLAGKTEEGGQGRVVVIAATNRPNAVDPALRRPGRFDREIEIGIPNAEARLEILRILLGKIPHSITDDELTAVANKTHGFVGADLASLVREAGGLAIHRWVGASTHNPDITIPTTTLPELSIMDLETSLPSIRPSAMREIFLETPTTRWSDIGGQSIIKQKLKECVEWPLVHAETFKRLGVRPPRGVLLYGPPGCSKTLVAKALATEGGVNFLAVKGPELLNKYVGESERAVREVFRKARAASPSIIFFDEIDALAGSRSDDSHGGPNEGVLTSLLNEMDGIEELTGVIVVAATNRPDVLDSALLRPGRLDRLLYVGPPDATARSDIFNIQLSKMATGPGVDAFELALMTDGCSGAEIVSICQDAALMAMNDNVEAPFVPREHFLTAAKSVRKRITKQEIERLITWRDQSGVRSV